MNHFVAWVILGVLWGSIASMIVNVHALRGILLNILVGIVGTFFVGMYLSPIFIVSITHHSGVTLASMLTASLGAIVLLFIVHMSRRSVR